LLRDYVKARDDLAQAVRLRPDYQEAKDVLIKAEGQLTQIAATAPPTPVKTELPPIGDGSPPVETVKSPVVAPQALKIEPAKPQPKAPPAPKPVIAPPATSGASVSAEEHDRRGRALTSEGKYPEALAELTAAIQSKPDFARAYNARGYVYELQRDYQHALTDFNEAIRLDANYRNAYSNRAIARRALGDKAGAADDQQKAR
jgi:tetratricopeptide (TPR) repeat protein